MEKLVKEADKIKFANSEFDKQKEFLRRIKEWKTKVCMIFEDYRIEKTFELISALLKESLDFKYVVREVEELKALSATYKWNDNANAAVNRKSVITIEDLQELIKEGKLNDYDNDKIKLLESLFTEATKLKNIVQATLKNPNPNTADTLEELNRSVEIIGIDLKEKASLVKLLKEVRQWRNECNEFLKGECGIEKFEEFKKTAEDLNTTCKEYEQVCQVMEPAIQWFSLSTKFLSKYSAPKPTLTLDSITSELRKRGSAAKTLQNLLDTATDISKVGEEYKTLILMNEQLREWEGIVEVVVAKYVSENSVNTNEIHDLLMKGMKHPIDKAKGLQLLDILNHETWLQKAMEALSNKVPLHVLEGIYREGNTFGVKVEAIEQYLKKLEEKIAAAKQWMNKYRHIKVDIERGTEKIALTELSAALTESELLNVKIREIEVLASIFSEAKELQENVKQALVKKNTLQELESLMGRVQEQNIYLEEVELLQVIYQLGMSWQTIATHVINSRIVYCTSLLPSLSETSKEVTIILNKCKNGGFEVEAINIKKGVVDEDEAVYCICRTNSEKKMVACDVCNEWFHLECINLSEELAEQIPQFVCSGCVRRKRIQVPYLNSLDSIERVTEKDFEKFLKEGNELPINFVELPILEEVKKRIENWKARAKKVLEGELECQFYIQLIEGRVDNDRYFKDSILNEEVLMKLYLESEGFPVEVELSNKIMNILMTKDWVHEILRYKAQGKSLKRKCKAILEQVQHLKIQLNLPEFYPLWEYLSTWYNPTTHSSVVDQGEYNKEETKEGSRYSAEYKLRAALETNRTPEKELREVYQKLLASRNADPKLLEQIKIILNNAEIFRAKAKEMYLRNFNDPRVLETICQQSLKVGCIPENVILLRKE